MDLYLSDTPYRRGEKWYIILLCVMCPYDGVPWIMSYVLIWWSGLDSPYYISFHPAFSNKHLLSARSSFFILYLNSNCNISICVLNTERLCLPWKLHCILTIHHFIKIHASTISKRQWSKLGSVHIRLQSTCILHICELEEEWCPSMQWAIHLCDVHYRGQWFCMQHAIYHKST